MKFITEPSVELIAHTDFIESNFNDCLLDTGHDIKNYPLWQGTPSLRLRSEH